MFLANTPIICAQLKSILAYRLSSASRRLYPFSIFSTAQWKFENWVWVDVPHEFYDRRSPYCQKFWNIHLCRIARWASHCRFWRSLVARLRGFYGVFCDVRCPPLGARIVRRVLQRVLGCYLRHGAFAFGKQYEWISPRNVPVKFMWKAIKRIYRFSCSFYSVAN